MKKKLLRQMLNEWRSNVWIVIEFIIVSVVLWYISDYLFATYSMANRPKGFDSEHCYLLTLHDLTSQSPEFIENRTIEQKAEDLREIMERLRRRPEIEAVSLSINSYPYNGSDSEISFGYDSIRNSGLHRVATADFVKVFRYEGINGETPEQLAKELEEGKILLSDNFFTYSNAKALRVSEIGPDRIYLDNDTSFIQTGTPLKPVRYDDFHKWSVFALFSRETESPQAMLWMSELCIRVRPDMDKDIIQTLMKEAQTQFHVGNFVLNDVESFDSIRQQYHQGDYDRRRNYLVGLGFMMLNIFLGLLGTFWFRTQQRVQEVALRKVNGATDRSVFGRLVSEGLLLLAAATPIAVCIDAILAKYEFNEWLDGYLVWSHLAVNAAITFVLMALMVVAGILFPAWRAMKIQPAEALKDE